MMDIDHYPVVIPRSPVVPLFSLVCNRCGKSPAPHVCSSCFDVAYCSRDCQVVDWEQGTHYLECPLRAQKPLRNSPSLPHESFFPFGYTLPTPTSPLPQQQDHQLIAPHLPLAPLQLGIVSTPAKAQNDYTLHHPQLMNQIHPLVALKDTSYLSTDVCLFFERFQAVRIIGYGRYGVVAVVTETSPSCSSIREYVAKIEPLEEEYINTVTNKRVIGELGGESWKRDLITHLQIAKLPPCMQWNVVLLHDWTRCRLRDIRNKLPRIAELPQETRRMISNKPIVYQILVMERAEGDTYALVKRISQQMSYAERLVWTREFCVQILSTLAQLHSRIGLEHNDLQLRNVMFSNVPSEHKGRSIMYQLPSHRWVSSSLGAVNNCVFKLADFGMSQVNYWTVENFYLTPQTLSPMSEFGENPSVITDRFDLEFLIQNISLRMGAGITEVAQLLADVKRDYSSVNGFGYDPERLLMTHPFFYTNVISRAITINEQADLAAEGNIIIPYMPFLSNEMEPINESVR